MNYAALLFPDFSLILCGYLLCRFTMLNRTVWQQVESLVYFFLFPVLLFQSILRNPLDLGASSHFIAASLLVGASGIALSYSLPWWPWLGRRFDARQHAAAAQIGFRFNGLIALALAERLGGGPGVLLIAVIIGFCVPAFNIAAVWPMARHSRTGFLRELVRNPFIIATTAGLAGNLVGLRLPSLLEPSLTSISAAATPLGLMAAGAGLQLHRLLENRPLALALLSIRHLMLPVVAFGLSLAFALPAEQTSLLLMFSALPTASSAYVLATRMGYDGVPVAGMITLSTLLAMLSLPFALSLIRLAG